MPHKAYEQSMHEMQNLVILSKDFLISRILQDNSSGAGWLWHSRIAWIQREIKNSSLLYVCPPVFPSTAAGNSSGGGGPMQGHECKFCGVATNYTNICSLTLKTWSVDFQSIVRVTVFVYIGHVLILCNSSGFVQYLAAFVVFLCLCSCPCSM